MIDLLANFRDDLNQAIFNIDRGYSFGAKRDIYKVLKKLDDVIVSKEIEISQGIEKEFIVDQFGIDGILGLITDHTIRYVVLTKKINIANIEKPLVDVKITFRYRTFHYNNNDKKWTEE